MLSRKEGNRYGVPRFQVDKLGTKLFFGAAGGGLGGIAGTLLGKAGVMGYLGSEGLGELFSYTAEGIYEGGNRLIENYKEYIESYE